MDDKTRADSLADTEKRLQSALGDSWLFSLVGVAIAIPLGIRRKSLSPLVFLGTTGAMLDIIQGVTGCEQEREAMREFLETKKRQGKTDELLEQDLLKDEFEKQKER
eukprot:TRINITY_DN20914_c0_g1_i1.p1 TRINITY_DN20914_c0_g1~~TRINITY_DN20914_c0_g1_i1.p1  ORF type:complete len:107 (-),score=28.85 TRINITY_DN20914_c0_g1_i1:482-802(-)